MCKRGEQKDVEKHHGDRLAERGLATQLLIVSQTLLNAKSMVS